jgi:hypothetical protein
VGLITHAGFLKLAMMVVVAFAIVMVTQIFLSNQLSASP